MYPAGPRPDLRGIKPCDAPPGATGRAPDRDHFPVAAWSEINVIGRMAPMKGIQ